jgi:hypothetical protein
MTCPASCPRLQMQRLDGLFGRLLRGEARPLVTAGPVGILRLIQIMETLFEPVTRAVGHRTAIVPTTVVDASTGNRIDRLQCFWGSGDVCAPAGVVSGRTGKPAHTFIRPRTSRDTARASLVRRHQCVASKASESA